MIRRWLPTPILSLLLWLVWLLVNNSLAPGQILLGLVLAIVIPKWTQAFWNPQPGLKKPLLALRFLLVLIWDILVANLDVALKILGPTRKLRPAFLEVPLDLREDFPITILASTISLTPGTVSAQLTLDRRTLLVHVLDVADPEALVTSIKQRYEQPLKEMFEC